MGQFSKDGLTGSHKHAVIHLLVHSKLTTDRKKKNIYID